MTTNTVITLLLAAALFGGATGWGLRRASLADQLQRGLAKNRVKDLESEIVTLQHRVQNLSADLFSSKSTQADSRSKLAEAQRFANIQAEALEDAHLAIADLRRSSPTSSSVSASPLTNVS